MRSVCRVVILLLMVLSDKDGMGLFKPEQTEDMDFLKLRCPVKIRPLCDGIKSMLLRLVSG